MDKTIFAAPRKNLTLDDCGFYHVMDLTGHQTAGEWDLRDDVDSYLGGYDFRDKRVLEIGPASGFLTIEMERRGGQVVAVEVEDHPGWDFVPFPASILEPRMERRRARMKSLKNSWWYVHEQFGSSAQMYYGDIYNLPDALGEFDVAVLSAVLTHCSSPVKVIEQCAKRARSIIIGDSYKAELEGRPICMLNPSATNRDWGTWWYFSTDFFKQFLGAIGYEVRTVLLHAPKYKGVANPQFTILASRPS